MKDVCPFNLPVGQSRGWEIEVSPPPGDVCFVLRGRPSLMCSTLTPGYLYLIGFLKPTLNRLSGPKIGSTEIFFISPGNRLDWMKMRVYNIIFYCLGILFQPEVLLEPMRRTMLIWSFRFRLPLSQIPFGVSNLCFVLLASVCIFFIAVCERIEMLNLVNR